MRNDRWENPRIEGLEKGSGRAGRLRIPTLLAIRSLITVFTLNQEIVKPTGLGPSNIAPDMAHQVLTRCRFAIMLQAKDKQTLKTFIPFVPVGNHAHNPPQHKQGWASTTFYSDNFTVH